MNTLARHAVLVASLLMTLAPAVAQEAPTTATAPATRPATADERAALGAYSTLPTDEPAVKRVFLNRDGSPRPDFGQPDPGFLRAHERFLERGKEPVGVLFLGDSITAAWNANKAVWDEAFGRYQPANFGIGGDRTEHVLWRIANGELDNIKPKVVVLMIGTNNSFRTAEDITKGVTAVVRAIQSKLPETKILLLGIFPRSAEPGDLVRVKLKGVNAELAKLADGEKVRYLEIWDQFLTPAGELTRQMMPDLLHLSPKAYQIWADAIGPALAEMTK